MRLKLLFGHLSIQILLLVFITGIVVTFLAPTPLVWLVVPVGIIAQMLNEYSLHRFIFHQAAPKSQWAFDLLYQLHYGHHDFPSKTGLFFVPAWFALPMLTVNILIAWSIYYLIGFPYPTYFAVATICVGGVGVFLSYEWFHMTAHMQTSKTTIEKYVTRLHGRHHFSDYKTLFHVTPGGVVVDKVMGTDYDPERVKDQGRVEFIKTLNLKPDDPRLMNARNRFADKYGFTNEEIEEASRS